MVPRLKEIDPSVPDKVDDPMLLGQPSRPGSAWKILERLGLPDSAEGIAQHSLHEIQRSERYLPVGLHPILEIVDKFRLEHGHPITMARRSPRATPLLLGQGQVLSGDPPQLTAEAPLPGLDSALQGDVERSSETS